MKISLEQKGTPFQLINNRREDLPEFFKDRGYRVGAEIGVYKGDFTRLFCQNGFKMYAVDPWLAYSDYFHLKADQAQMEREYERAKIKLAPYDCTIIRKIALEALNDIPDESLDFVYIDGNHDFLHATEDIWWWSRKVKRGGVISGHDYWNGRHQHLCDVKWVLDGITQALHIKNWYVIGEEDKPQHTKPSWFWLRP
jgi:hypothetical protein